MDKGTPDTKVILILACATTKFNWKINKHLAPIAGVPLILHTVRQIKRLTGCMPVVVTQHDSIVEAVGVEAYSYEPEKHRWYAETFLYTRPLWREFNAVFLGDTIYPDEVLKDILDQWWYDGCPLLIHGRPFGDFDAGVTFPMSEANKVAGALKRAVMGIEERKKLQGHSAWVGSTGPFMRALCGHDLWEAPPRGCKYHREMSKEFLGYTYDFDKPAQYEAWLEKNEWAR